MPELAAVPEPAVVPVPVTAPIMRADGITLRFGGVTALSGVSFEIGASEIHAIIGPNGAVWGIEESAAHIRHLCRCLRSNQ